MNKTCHLLMRLFILFFTVSVSVTILPCGSVYASGLFGEVKFSTVTEDNEFLEESENQAPTEARKNKGINIINIWYESWCAIICMIFALYVGKLPRGDTIVALKVRMDN